MRFREHTTFALALAMMFAAVTLGVYLYGATRAQTPVAKVTYGPISGGEYKVDPAHSILGFSIRHLEIAWVEGRFKDFTGVINYDEKDISKSSVDFSAKVASIDTGVEPRNAHLRTADFFDANTYPEMTFKSTKVERKGRDDYMLYGDLTIKGVTKPVALPFTIAGAVKDPWGNTRFGIEAQTKINRRQFGINYERTLANGGSVVADEVTINLQLEAVKPDK